MIDKKIRIGKAKGRPMLNWVGKRPLDFVKGFPAQLVEVFDPSETGQKTEIPTYENLENNWQNLLFHGDNKEVLATLLENGFRGKIDLIYIDPPFNTGVNYIRRVQLRGLKTEKLEGENYSLQEQTMYFNNFADDTYLQFIYERIQLLKELLSETGSIFVRIDENYVFYYRMLLNEIFGPDNYINEILLKRKRKSMGTVGKLEVENEFLLWYKKGEKHIFNINQIAQKRKITDFKWTSLLSQEERQPRERDFFGLTLVPPSGQHWTFNQDKINQLIEENYIRLKCKNCGSVFYYDSQDSGEKFIKKISQRKKDWFKFFDVVKDSKVYGIKKIDSCLNCGSKNFSVEYLVSEKVKTTNNWMDISSYTDRSGYPTENAEVLLERVINLASNPNDLVLDCFIGSGTTAAVAQKLNRRWIGCDINKGAIQTTSKRLQKIILEQMKKKSCKYPVFAHYKVNDYDLKLLRTEAIELACQHIGIQRIKTDLFFDGTLGNNLVKIIEFNHPLTLLDLQLLEDELKKRPDEDRNITIVCLGKEISVDTWIEEWNKKHPVNKLNIIELRTDRKYGKFLIHRPAEAEIEIKRITENKAKIKIKNFISPAIIDRLNSSDSLVKVKISDFRSMIDCILIDSNYDGKTFHIIYSDVPEKKNDLIKGEYEIEISKEKTIVAIKIIDMLGEEVLMTKEI